MDTSLRLVVCHADAGARAEIAGMLAPLHEVMSECGTCEELLEAAGASPDVIVTAVELPDGDALSVLIELCREKPVPSVVVTGRRSLGLVQRAMQDHVMAYLLEPVRGEELHAAIMLARARHAQLAELAEQVQDLRQALSDRKVIEKAKGVLMATEGLNEDEAFAQLRRRAQDKRRRIVEEAEEVLRVVTEQ
jgi:response regulator NasT